MSYDALIYAVTGGDLGEPQFVQRDMSDRVYDFETPEGEEPKKPDTYGFKMKGFGECVYTTEKVHGGKAALTTTPRFADWMGITCDISDFLGQERPRGIDELLEVKSGLLRIRPQLLDCDLYRFMKNDPDAVNAPELTFLPCFFT